MLRQLMISFVPCVCCAPLVGQIQIMEQEPNNYRTQAQILPLDRLQTAVTVLGRASLDIDFFVLILTEPATLEITTPTLGMYCSVSMSRGTASSSSSSFIGGASFSRSLVRSLQPGEYDLVVYSDLRPGPPDYTIEFRLTFPERELPINVTHRVVIPPLTESSYTFTVPNDDTYAISADPRNLGVQTFFTLLSPEGERIGSSSLGDGPGEAKMSVGLCPGTHFLGIENPTFFPATVDVEIQNTNTGIPTIAAGTATLSCRAHRRSRR